MFKIQVDANICRVCLKGDQQNTAINIFAESHLEILELFRKITQLKIKLNDGMSELLCQNCYKNLEKSNKFIKLSLESDKRQRIFLDKINNHFQKISLLNLTKTKFDSDEDEILKKEGYIIESDSKVRKLELRKNEQELLSNHKKSEQTFINLPKLIPRPSNRIVQVLKKELETHCNSTSSILNNHDISEKNAESLKIYRLDKSDNPLDITLSLDLEENEIFSEPTNLFIANNEHFMNVKSDVEYEENATRDINKTEKEKKYLEKNLEGNEECNDGKPDDELDENSLSSLDAFLQLPRKKKIKLDLKSTDLNKKSTSVNLSNGYKCSICDLYFSEYLNLDEHVKNLHKVVKYKVTQPQSLLLSYNEIINYPVSYESSTEKNPIETVVEANCVSNEKSFQCVICKETFTQRKVLSLHMSTHLQEKKFACSQCGEEFRLHNLFQSHMKSEHNSLKRKCKRNLENLVERKLSDNKKGFLCELCGKQFTKIELLKMHERNFHSFNNHITCDKIGCGVKVLKQNFKYHLELHKRNEDEHTLTELKKNQSNPEYECGVCKEIFNKQEMLFDHMKIHSHPHECQFCDKRFEKRHGLVRHLTTGHQVDVQETIQLWYCSVCQVPFSCNEALSEHFQTKHSKKIK